MAISLRAPDLPITEALSPVDVLVSAHDNVTGGDGTKQSSSDAAAAKASAFAASWVGAKYVFALTVREDTNVRCVAISRPSPSLPPITQKELPLALMMLPSGSHATV